MRCIAYRILNQLMGDKAIVLDCCGSATMVLGSLGAKKDVCWQVEELMKMSE